MKIKSGASIQGLDILMRPVLIEASAIWGNHGHELVITSGNENVAHGSGSLHPYGLALDFRTRYFTTEEKSKVFIALTGKLRMISINYDVVLEKDHMHVEYDE